MPSTDVVGLFQDLVRRRDPQSINVPAAALAMARVAYPELAVDACLDDLAAMGHAAAERVGGSSGESRVTRLNHYVFSELRFRGNKDDYYDPRNSFLNDVLERRAGIPITLALVYIDIAATSRIAVEGIGFPGHFLVRDVSTGWILDPFNGGARLEIADCKDLFVGQGHAPEEWTEELLVPVTKAQFLLRMINNLRRHYSQAGDKLRLAMLEAMAAAVVDGGDDAPSSSLH
jgi:regulator of sirC expression with transglutaminase-like and TPR domain